GVFGVAPFELGVVHIGELAGSAVKFDLAQRGNRHIALALTRRERRIIGAPLFAEEQRIEDERQRADREHRPDDQGNDHASPSPPTAASRRDSSSLVAFGGVGDAATLTVERVRNRRTTTRTAAAPTSN